jgi:hypothetical protein
VSNKIGFMHVFSRLVVKPLDHNDIGLILYVRFTSVPEGYGPNVVEVTVVNGNNISEYVRTTNKPSVNVTYQK